MTALPSARSVVPTVTLQPTSTTTPTLRALPSVAVDPAATGTPQAAVVPVGLPDTGYGPQAATRDRRGSDTPLGGVLLGLLALAGGWVGSLRRRSRRG